MPHAIEYERPVKAKTHQKSKQNPARELRQLHILYNQTKTEYQASTLSSSIIQLLESKNRPAVSRIVSLGLGSLHSSDQSRRIKQLVILLSIAEQFQRHNADIDIYAQDPSFSKTDEVFLESLGIQILSTPAATDLGEAAHYITESALVYSPFLTLEAYQLLFATKVNAFIGDDFNALRIKWPKHSVEKKEVEQLFRQSVQSLKRRPLTDDNDFWGAEEKPFPMAMYSKVDSRKQLRKVESRL